MQPVSPVSPVLPQRAVPLPRASPVVAAAARAEGDAAPLVTARPPSPVADVARSVPASTGARQRSSVQIFATASTHAPLIVHRRATSTMMPPSRADETRKPALKRLKTIKFGWAVVQSTAPVMTARSEMRNLQREVQFQKKRDWDRKVSGAAAKRPSVRVNVATSPPPPPPRMPKVAVSKTKAAPKAKRPSKRKRAAAAPRRARAPSPHVQVERVVSWSARAETGASASVHAGVAWVPQARSSHVDGTWRVATIAAVLAARAGGDAGGGSAHGVAFPDADADAASWRCGVHFVDAQGVGESAAARCWDTRARAWNAEQRTPGEAPLRINFPSKADAALAAHAAAELASNPPLASALAAAAAGATSAAAPAASFASVPAPAACAATAATCSAAAAGAGRSGGDERCSSSRQAGLGQLQQGGFKELIHQLRAWSHAPTRAAGAPQLRANFAPALGAPLKLRVLRIKNWVNANANAMVLNAILDALLVNTSVEVLYIQNFERGFEDAQMKRLCAVLRRGRCVVRATHAHARAHRLTPTPLPPPAGSGLSMSERTFASRTMRGTNSRRI